MARGWRVFGSARRREDAERLERELGPGFQALLFDVTDAAAVAEAAACVRGALGGRRLAGVVANAGIGIPAPLEHQSVEDWRYQIEVNLVGTMITAKTFLPLVGTDPSLTGPKGRIVTMSSLGGKLGQPFVTAYIASKFGIEGFSEALRREISPFDIQVIVMAPSAVATPVWEKVEKQDLSRFSTPTPLRGPAFPLRRSAGMVADKDASPTRGPLRSTPWRRRTFGSSGIDGRPGAAASLGSGPQPRSGEAFCLPLLSQAPGPICLVCSRMLPVQIDQRVGRALGVVTLVFV